MVFKKNKPISTRYGSFEEYYQNESPKGQKQLKEKLDLESKKLELQERKQNLENQKVRNKIENKRLRTYNSKNTSQNVSMPQNMNVPTFSRQQQFLRELFGHGQKIIFNSPDSECRTTLNGALINNVVNGYPIEEDTTADSFGFGYQRKSTGKFFGIR